MPTRTILLMASLLCTPAQADELIRQTQLTTGLVWDFHPSQNRGQTWAPIPVDIGGSSFSLFALNPGKAPLTLDTTTVGTGFPQTNITIHSADPHLPKRTRADQPFTVTVQRHGANQKHISLKHTKQKYNPATRSPESRPASNSTWWRLGTQTRHSGTFYTTIHATNPTLAQGEETFTAYAASNNRLQPLKTASIQVWPVASASITGTRNNGTVKSTEQLHSLTVHCNDLYPDSITYVQVYRGQPRLGTLGAILPQTIIRYDTEVPQDQKIPLGNFADALADGTYTLEVLHITPFNQRKPERLSHISFVIDRGNHSPGLVSTKP